MKGKKLAARAGMVFLSLLLACTFFSKSFSAYLTPKVTAVKPQPGIIPKDLTLNGVFEAPQKSEVTVEEAKANPIEITTIHVKRGESVKAGQVIVSADPGENPANEAASAEKELESLRLAMEDWKRQLEGARLDLDKQIEAQQEQNRNLKQSLQMYTAKVQRENGANPSLETAEKKLELAQREYELLKQQKEDPGEQGLLNSDRQINEKEGAVETLEKQLKELEDKVKSDPEAAYQLEKLKKDLNQAKTELSTLAGEYSRQYDSLNASNERQISQKKDEMHQLLLQITKLSAVPNRSEEEQYQLNKALADYTIAQKELDLLQKALGSASNSTLVNLQSQIFNKEDQVHTLEQKLQDAGDEAQNQTDREQAVDKAKTELSLAEKELALLRKERLRQSETSRLDLEKQLLDKENEVESLQDGVNKLQGTSDSQWQLDKTKTELRINERELKLSAEKKRDLAGGVWQGKTLEMQEKDLEKAEQKLEKAREKLEHLTEIKADRAGVLVEVGVSEGDTYQGDKPVFVIMPSGMLEIRADIPEDEAEEIETGMECTFTEGSRSGSAKVARIEEKAGEQGTRFVAVIEPEEAFFRYYTDPLILKGRSATVTVSYNSGFSPAVVPNSAIFEEEGSKKVYLLKQRSGFWGEEYYIEKASVTLMDYNSKNSSVQGVGMNESVVTGWDRPLEDKQRVLWLQE